MKTFKKRILALLMVVSVLFASCGQKLPKLNPASPVSLNIWHYYNGMQKTAFDKLVSEFNETVGIEKGISITAYGQGDVNALTEKVLAAAEKKVGADELPDMFAAYADTAYAVDKFGLVASMDEYLSPSELAEYRAEFLDEGRFDKDGSLKIFPVAKSSEVLAINKTDWDKFASATNADVASLSTIEGVVKIAEKYYNWTDSLTATPSDGKAFFGRDAMANYMLIGAKQLGNEIFNVSSGTVSINTDKQTFKTLWDNYYIPFIKGYFAANNRFRSDDIKTGTIVALVGSTSGIKYFPDKVNISDTQNYDIECNVMPAPIFDGKEKIAVQQGAGIVITKSEKIKEYACTIFLKWFTDNERNIEFAAASSYLPVKIAACDPEKIIAAEIVDGTPNNKVSLTVTAAVQTLNEYKMYTSKAFDGGIKARSILENSLFTKSKADYDAVMQEISEGKSRDEALSTYLTDATFEQWYTQICDELNNL